MGVSVRSQTPFHLIDEISLSVQTRLDLEWRYTDKPLYPIYYANSFLIHKYQPLLPLPVKLTERPEEEIDLQDQFNPVSDRQL